MIGALGKTPDVLAGTCHCGAARIEIPRRPRMLCERGAAQSYAWGRKALRFVRCATCGCIMNWERVKPRKVIYMGVNARNFEPSALGAVRIRLLDGADTWKYLD